MEWVKQSILSIRLTLFLLLLFKEPKPVGGPNVDRHVLAAAHAHEEGDPHVRHQLVRGAERTACKKMCLLEEIPTSIGLVYLICP